MIDPLESIDFERLRTIGFAPALMPQLGALMQGAQGVQGAQGAPNDPASTPMRVTEVQREGLTLHDGAAEHPARLLPALRQQLADAADAVAVGDWVLAARNTFGEWWVQQRLAPLNQLARRLHDGRDKVERVVIASNIDTALLVMGLDHDFNLQRLQRYLALVRMAGVAAVVVLSKRDLAPAAEARLREVQAMLPDDLCAVAVNALGDEAALALAPWLQRGQTLVLLGSSGAGKSTLTNTLTGHCGSAGPQRTGASRADDGRGRHTTTTRSLHRTPGGACIIDTPGLRTLRLDGDAGELEAAFDDIARLALHCRFRDCQHQAEPGCAVREGVDSQRLRSFHKLLREAGLDTQTALERKAQVQQWKVRSKAMRVRLASRSKG